MMANGFKTRDEILKDILPDIHALEMKTWTEDQWEKQKNKSN